MPIMEDESMNLSKIAALGALIAFVLAIFGVGGSLTMLIGLALLALAHAV